jgi:small subunit ribosomal protein S14
MAKKSSVEKNERRRRLAKKFAGKRARLKATTQDQSLPMEERFAAQLKLAQLPRNSAPTRIRNRCEITGRPRAFYRKVRMSRLALRDLANRGLIPGMVKASW